MKNKVLLERLNDIGTSLSKTESALALLGLGSVGIELDRLDEYSDLDFFVITTDEAKQSFIDDLSWLNKVYPIGYAFKNTVDGYKFFFKDGIYGEFAVFGINEVPSLYQSQGRIVWQKQGYNILELETSKGMKPVLKTDDVDFHIHEALTNIYVGLTRFKRGEKLSAYRFIETYAFNNLLKVVHHFEEEKPGFLDEYNIERRFEKHVPKFANHLSNMLMGYDNVIESAENIYKYITKHYEVPTFLKNRIVALLKNK
jgi:lincosamide nucleotidyltransferase B/F